MDKDSSLSATRDKHDSGGPAVVALLGAVGACAVLWRQIGDAGAWWWVTATGITDGLALGELVVFCLGLVTALVAVTIGLIAAEKILGFLRDMGSAFAAGWRRG